ncbi:polyadenylation and cleavage factor homolog 4-like [Nymphaea colorata]|nr:polyadenylation and cleavage factor homolog 4-like [Nymphaea colorata]
MEEGKYKSRAPNSLKNGGGFLLEMQPNTANSRKASEFSPAAAGPPVPPPSAPSSSPLLERFRAFLREREEEMGVSSEGPSQEEIVDLYRLALLELTFNSKPIITDLTIIAGEQLAFGKGIAAVICSRIVQVPTEQKLPTLYLLDSIVKNIGGDYIRYFAARLHEVFCKAYRQVDSSLYPAMRHLFGTWVGFFPSNVLCAIEADLQFSPMRSQSSGLTSSRPISEANSPRPAHGIHVNPKYLEARRCIDHPNLVRKGSPQNSVQSSSLEEERLEAETTGSRKVKQPHGAVFSSIPHGKVASIGHREYDFDQGEVSSQRMGIGKADLRRMPMETAPPIGGTERLVSSSRVKLTRPLSPARSSSPPDGRTTLTRSPRKIIVEKASPSRSLLGSRTIEVRSDQREWHDMHLSYGANQMTVSSAAMSSGGQSNGYSQHRRPLPGVLTDAYGNYRGKGTLHGKVSKIEQIDVTGINNGPATRSWQNSEEEEYIWEDMSPTLSDRSKKNDLASSESTSVRTNTWMNLQTSSAQALKAGLNRGNHPSQDSRSFTNDRFNFVEEGNLVPYPGRRYNSRESLGTRRSRNEPLPHILSSGVGEEHSTLVHRFGQPLQQQLELKAGMSSFQFVGPLGGVTQLSGQPNPSASSHVLETSMLDRYSRAPAMTGPLQVEGYGLDKPPASSRVLTTEKYVAQRPHSPSVAWSPSPAALPLTSGHASRISQQKSQFDLLEIKNSQANQGQNPHSINPLQRADDMEKKSAASVKLLELPYRHPLLTQPNHADSEQVIPILPPQGSSVFPGGQHLSVLTAAHPRNQGTLQEHGNMGVSPIISAPGISPLFIPSTVSSSHILGKPPLPPGLPPSLSQVGPPLLNSAPILPHPQSGNSLLGQQPGHALTGLISSLMSQGLIKPPSVLQELIGLEFNEQVLRVRHESAINALYADLPRQCTTCGLRFKLQEEHSNHMDWHVTKNRISRNRKQKQSRKWFVSAKEWLSGAEGVGADAVPAFLPIEMVSEKKEEEMAVPADENQNVCALCGEPFEDFYSDETEEWMYKGAVYMNAPDGFKEGMERSQLGPIVHSKCRSESTFLPLEDADGVEMGEDDILSNQRKRIRL